MKKIYYLPVIILLIGLFIYLVNDRNRAVDECTKNTGNRIMCEAGL